jgi:cell division protein FtsB
MRQLPAPLVRLGVGASSLWLRLRRTRWGVVIGCGLAVYFVYHAIEGSRGWYAYLAVEEELAATEMQLVQLRTERLALEQRVRRLSDGSIDPDLLDELARRHLSLVDPLDVIILLETSPRER